MHAETLALLTKPLYFPNMNLTISSSCHGRLRNMIISLRIFLQLKNPLKISLLITAEKPFYFPVY